MTNPENQMTARNQDTGFRSAVRNSIAGIQHAITHDKAIRREVVALAILLPISIVAPVSDLEHLLLVLSLMLVILVEFINSSIESAIDRISTESHQLSKQSKDMASSAVFIAVLMAGLSWVVIMVPLGIRLATQST